MPEKSLLFTPGPVTTHPKVQQAALGDFGFRCELTSQTIDAIRNNLLLIAGDLDPKIWTTILLPGSGTYGVEAVISSVISSKMNGIYLSNGNYGRRIGKILKYLNLTQPPILVDVPADQTFDLDQLEQLFKAKQQVGITLDYLVLVHHETTSGVTNPLAKILELARKYFPEIITMVDAISSFGGIPIDFNQINPSYLIFSANKCLEGLPGISCLIANRAQLIHQAKHARSLSFDLLDHWQYLEDHRMFRFTPPTNVLMALKTATELHLAEGGTQLRYQRYLKNQRMISSRFQELGFPPYLTDPEIQGPIVTCFYYPLKQYPQFDFVRFHQELSAQGFCIFTGILVPGVLRIGNIGQLGSSEINQFLTAVEQILLTHFTKHPTTSR